MRLSYSHVCPSRRCLSKCHHIIGTNLTVSCSFPRSRRLTTTVRIRLYLIEIPFKTWNCGIDSISAMNSHESSSSCSRTWAHHHGPRCLPSTVDCYSLAHAGLTSLAYGEYSMWGIFAYALVSHAFQRLSIDRLPSPFCSSCGRPEDLLLINGCNYYRKQLTKLNFRMNF